MSARRSLTTPHAPTLTRGDDWRDLALCRWQDPELFFAPGNEWTRHRDQEAAAKAVCETCPVRALCLADGLARGDDYAILGGLTTNERRRLHRKKPAARNTVRVCPKGHDKDVLGRYSNGDCAECGRERGRRAKQKGAVA